jgi:hypothetical protein
VFPLDSGFQFLHGEGVEEVLPVFGDLFGGGLIAGLRCTFPARFQTVTGGFVIPAVLHSDIVNVLAGFAVIASIVVRLVLADGDFRSGFRFATITETQVIIFVVTE